MGKRTKTSFSKAKKPPRGGRPKGISPAGPELRATKQLDKASYQRFVADMLYKTDDELRAIEKNKTVSMLYAIVAKCLLRVRATGDVYAWNAMLDRYIGPVKQEVSVTPQETAFEQMSDDELAAARKQYAEINHNRILGIEKEREMFKLINAREVNESSPSPGTEGDTKLGTG